MNKEKIAPNFIFESSWEVCNKVGGIYTVLSTRALTLQKMFRDKVFFIGPDCCPTENNVYFTQDDDLLSDWREHAEQEEGLHVRVGRWNVPGEPITLLVDFKPFFTKKDAIFGKMWEWFQVDSLHAYGDYDEASMFSFAAGKVVESFYRYFKLDSSKVIYHANEWMTGLGALYIQHSVPAIATVFTTHATSIGRSIAGNNKPLYQYLPDYNGDQMARELNMESKHSIEKQTAWHVDCFTTVSDITARECKELLDKPVDEVLPNGFEADFVPKGAAFNKKRKEARQLLLKVAADLTGDTFDDDTIIVSTSGRYEFRNKGIDLFIESMNRLRQDASLQRKIVAFICVPAWVFAPREDLADRLKTDDAYTTPLQQPVITHWLHNMGEDRALGMMRYLGISNAKEDKVKLIFVPCYLTGDDGIINKPYYDIVLGNDLCVYPSYYEPWGYTPLEAIAFKVPCITTDLAGFGLWANQVKGADSELADGVKVVHRTDYNYNEVADAIKETVLQFAAMSKKEADTCRANASKLSKKAYWSHFITYYEEAYDIALRNAEKRNAKQ